MPATYRVGVIGHTGRGNYGHGIDTVWLDLPECEVVAVADADPKGLEQAAARLKAPKAYADYRKLLDEAKVDIVSICPRWLDEHRDMVVAAAEHGVHVYMEKPFCRTLAEADQMVAACQKHHVKLAIAFQTRYSPKLQVIRDMIADGAIGEVLEMRGRGKEDRRGGGEDLWVLGTHIMNLLHHFGGEPRWCFSTVLQNRRPISKSDVREGNEGIGLLAGDEVHALYGLDTVPAVHFDSRSNGAGSSGNRFGISIYGTQGVIFFTTGFLPTAFYLANSRWSTAFGKAEWVPITSAGPGKPEPLTDGSAHAGNIVACRDLIAAIEEDREPEASIYEARTTVEMIAAVFQSQCAGTKVALPLENRENPLASL